MKRLFLIIIIALILINSIEARSYRNRPGDVMTSLNQSVQINWTSGFAYVSVSVDVPAVDRKNAAASFDIPGSLSEARSLARDKARRLAEDRLFDELSSIRIDGKNQLSDIVRSSSNARSGLGNLKRMIHTKSRRTSEGFVALELAVDLYGSRGLASILPAAKPALVPEMVPVLPEDSDTISSVIVVVDTEKFEPALRPAIYSDTGRMIYGPPTLPANLKRPAVLYYKTVNAARRSELAGRKPYIVYASDVISNSDVIIDSQDARRIVGASSGRDSLERSRVLFVIPDSTNDR